MRRLVTASLALFVVLLVGSAAEVRAQNTMGQAPSVPHIYTFESVLQDTVFLNGIYGDTPDNDDDRPYFEFYSVANPDPVQGDSALLVNWTLFSSESWGGSMGLVHGLLPAAEGETMKYYDFSDFTHIRFWVNVLQAADPAQVLRLKLHDASDGMGATGSQGVEEWYSESGSILQTPAGTGWVEYVMPLEVTATSGSSVPAGGFSRPGCPDSCWSGTWGNGELDLDQVSGFALEFTGPQFGAVADSMSIGSAVFDNLQVTGVRYNLVEGFESTEGLSTWKNSTAGTLPVLTTVADTVQGAAAIQFQYNLVADQSWGGSTGMARRLPGSEVHEDMSARTHLSLFYKVLDPLDDVSTARLQVKLYENDNATAAEETWEYQTDVVLGDTTGRWQRLLIPLVQRTGGPNNEGFTIPPWVSGAARGDDSLNTAAIRGWVLEVSGTTGTTSTGTVLFDRLTGYGNEIIDFVAPVAVQGLTVTASSAANTNMVSWDDVPDEENETYTIFYSLDPITTLGDPGVMVAADGIAGDIGVFMHEIFAPVSDQAISYYYAIRATDEVGNVGPISSTSAPTEQTGEGLVTVSLTPPANFTADGDLGEWSGITPIHIAPDGEFVGHVASGTMVTDAADLSADVYLAIDNQAIYFAYDVTDDVYVPVPYDTSSNRWLYDGAELYLGLYDEVGARHAGFQSGAEPDYKFYLYQQIVNRDGADSLALAGDGNYTVTPKSNGLGYVIEGKLPHSIYTFDTATGFVPKDGMRIPLDIVLMDNDNVGSRSRQGILAYSPFNDDDSYLSPTNWFMTWIGTSLSSDAEQDNEVPNRFALEQNYPNPFNPSTLIKYEVPNAGRVTLKVYNLLGQLVTTLVDGTQAQGRHEVRFDAHNMASGVYFYQLQANDQMITKKMLLIR